MSHRSPRLGVKRSDLSSIRTSVVRRLALSVLVVLGAASTGFAAVRLTPGDPVRTLLGAANQDAALVERVRTDLNLDQPLWIQYGSFIGDLLRGDFGMSYQLQQPVSELITSQIGSTLELAFAAFALALVVGVVLAILTAGRRPALRAVSSFVELVTVSSPPFWIGLLLLTLFSFRWNLFPAIGSGGFSSLVLPAIALATGLVGAFAQVLREGLEKALEEPFALTARARGTSETLVRLRHALRFASLPLLTLSGWTVGTLVGGAVVVETVFSRPGLGRLLATAVESRDFPIITGVIVVSALAFVVINTIVDALYRVVDPRLRGENA